MKIVVFTGAGVSRESGLLTFRDSKDGLWEGHDIEAVCSIQGWQRDPQRVLDFYNSRRRDVIGAVPNDAHIALADLEKAHDVTVITQNIDDLHERGGSTNVIHLHGEILKVFAEDDYEQNTIPWRDDLNLGDLHPDFGSQLRPFVVWFGEGLPRLNEAMAVGLAPDVDILIVVGTSLSVYPAANIALQTRASQTYFVDPEAAHVNIRNLTHIQDRAVKGVRGLVDRLLAA